ncbi:unnamed protein product [Porites lobata]|uniref:Uncharacterized protein n=1 Tax=Porites lobata TaxID=104759 RepID=A0ABN8MXJ9_9CNID|nr:unnamed protein product [Porites lobata]
MYKCRLVPWLSYGKSNEDVQKKYTVYTSSYEMGTLNIMKESPLRCVSNWCFSRKEENSSTRKMLEDGRLFNGVYMQNFLSLWFPIGLDCCDYPLNDPPTFLSDLSLVLGSSSRKQFTWIFLLIGSSSLRVNSLSVDKTKFLISFPSRRVTTDSLETKTLIHRLVELGKCAVQQLKLVKHDKRNYANNGTIEVPYYNSEEDGTLFSNYALEELSPCSVITGYSFTTRTHRLFKLLISANETKNMKEYKGDKFKDYIVSNNEEAWVYHYYFSEPIPARFVQFSADQSEDSQCLYGLTLSGCTLVKSRCKPKSFTADDILCGDRQSSLLNKEEVRKLASCSLITGYQLASNVSRSHKLMISGLNSKLLTE